MDDRGALEVGDWVEIIGNAWCIGRVGRIFGFDMAEMYPVFVELEPGGRGFPRELCWQHWIGLRPEEVRKIHPSEELIATWMLAELSR